MGIALSTLSAALPHSLQGLSRWLHNLVRLEESARPGSTDTSAPDAHGHGTCGEHPEGAPNPQGPQGQREGLHGAGSPRRRPLRGNWPFTVQPAASQPKAATAVAVAPAGTRSCAGGNRSFLATPGSSSRDAFMASIACGTLPHRPSAAVRTLSHTSGRLVIAGRMADVCAELDRMAACEALQA